jgi:hypothetical protein
VLDVSGVNFIPLKQTTLTINTSGVEDAFAVSTEDTITPTIEIEITKSGTPKTVYQGNVTIRKDLITAGSVVPGDQAQYYTKSESNALFFPAVCGGFNFTAGALLDATPVTAINYNTRNLLDAAGNNSVSWGNGVQFQSAGLGFYGATPITKPDNVSLLNAISSLGLIGTGVSLAIGTITFPGFDGSSSTTFTFTAPTISLPASTTITIGTTGLKIGTTTAQKIGFFNATPIVQPVSTNVVSALNNLGLIASTVTLGPVVTAGDLTNYIQNSAANVNATSRLLASSDSQTSVDYGTRTLNVTLSGTPRTVVGWAGNSITFYRGIVIDDSAGSASLTAISLGTSIGTQIGTTTSQKLAFYNSSPIVQPSNTNAVSGLINLGLLATGTTYGVLPQSTETLTVVTGINFGTVPNNSSTSVTVTITGAAVNDIVLLGLPATISEGLTFLGHVVAANQVHVDAINATNSSITTSNATYRITVIGY